MQMQKDNKLKKKEKIIDIINQCKYEIFESTEDPHNGKITTNRIEKLDQKKFRTTYFSQTIKDDINDEILLTKLKKEAR